MANYTEFSSNKLDWVMPFQRTNPFPLDRSSIFDSVEDAKKYAKGDISDPDKRELCGTSYIGQIITVYEDSKVKIYKIEEDRSLSEVDLENIDILSKLSEDENGDLLYNEKQIKGQTIQKTELPTPSTVELGKIYQYTGVTTETLIHAYFYECIENGDGTYSWVKVISSSSGEGGNGTGAQVDTLPTVSEDELNNIYQYIGETTDNYKNGYFYKCVFENDVYTWRSIKVQDVEQSTEYVTLKELETHAQSNLHLTETQRNSIHTHNNKTNVLDKLGVSNNSLTFDGKSVAGDIPISEENGNIISVKEDGIYASETEMKVSTKNGNIIEKQSDGSLYAKYELPLSNDIGNRLKKDKDDKYYVFNPDISENKDNAISYDDNGALYSKEIKISDAENNALIEKEDGTWFVSSSGVKISTDEGNIITEGTDNGLFAKADELKKSDKENNILYIEPDKSLYVPKTMISRDLNNGLIEKADGFYVPALKISSIDDNSIEQKSDGLYSPTLKISQESGNGIIEKTDGIYMSSTGVKISADEGNIITTSDNDQGLYAKADELKKSSKTDNILSIESDKSLYVPKTKISNSVTNSISYNKNNELYAPKFKIKSDDKNALTGNDTDGYYVESTRVSEDEGNCLVKKDDGSFYVAKGNVIISDESDNILKNTDKGLYVKKVSADISDKTGNIITKDENDKLYAKYNILKINSKSPNTNGEITINLDDVSDGKTRKMPSFETTNLSKTYVGNKDKVISSKYLFDNFPNKSDILDKLSKDDTTGELIFDGVAVAADVLLDSSKDNIITKSEKGLLVDGSKYMDKETYTDSKTSEILGEKIKTKTISFEDLTDIGEYTPDIIEQIISDHISDRSIHNTSTLNAIIIQGNEFAAGTLTNFRVDSDGFLELAHYTEEPLTYTLDKAIFTSKIYDVGESLPWVNIMWFATYSPYIANVSVFIRMGSTPIVDAENWTDWKDVTTDKSLKDFENSQYMQLRIEGQTSNRNKNIKFDYLTVFYGYNDATELALARKSLDGTERTSLKARLDDMETYCLTATEDEINEVIDEAVQMWNDLVYPPKVPEEDIEIIEITKSEESE